MRLMLFNGCIKTVKRLPACETKSVFQAAFDQQGSLKNPPCGRFG
ncbi:hypothetical protein HMPREF9123_0088 [Neisseria bacilliformis ATCC BAA-1200]|uniref:Uncharacterized protein n=1 Tax=Neisseria bacilliformis ATCC BAA-1200 TaxID=888742 RepID=F2B8N5_9NEIS|nr:hypothetical protein HMPREF9123_0088 [Neisseria bacilliformis ATCC BAA-1200]